MKRKWPKLSDEQIRNKSRILVVDDQNFPYVELFKKDGYSIDKWDDIDDLPSLENGRYNIILLDLQGVGKNVSAEEGLGILKHLKKRNPTQIIIAFSNADWPLKYHEFFNLADHTLSKNEDYLNFKNVVDEFLRKTHSLEFYLSKIEHAAGGAEINPAKLMKIAQKSIVKENAVILEKFIKKKIQNRETVGTVVGIVNIAIEVFKVCTTVL